MRKPLSENAKAVLDYVVDHKDEDITAKEMADALGLGVQSVNGIVTSTFGKRSRNLMERVEGPKDEQTGKTPKFIKLIADRFEDYDVENDKFYSEPDEASDAE